MYWNGEDSVRRGFPGNPLGAHASHTFSLYFYKSTYFDPNTMTTVNAAVAAVEDGGKVPFTWNGAAWIADEGRIATLDAGAPGTCLAEATLTRGDGTIYRFSDWCVGSALEGQPVRVDRRSGDFLLFQTSATGQILQVTDRRGAATVFEYGPPYQYGPSHEDWGTLSAVVSPTGDRFEFSRYAGFLREIVAPGQSSLWSVTVNNSLDGDTFPGTLARVDNARGFIAHQWAWAAGTDGPVLQSEEGADPLSKLTFAEGTGDSLRITFRPAGSSTDVTNEYFWSQEPGSSPRVVDRTLQGACPNCGAGDTTRTFWPGSTNVHAVEDANGFVTVYEDPDNPGNPSAAYDANGNPLVAMQGCGGTASLPVCANPRRLSFTYLSGTNVVETATQPSAKGGSDTTTETRMFDGTSTRVTHDRRTGYTATTLDGQLDSSQTTRSTKSTYGGGPSGIDLTRFEGPYAGAGEPDASAPRTDYSYYTLGQNDACAGHFVAANAKRLASVTRYVDATNTLTTYYCSYDSAGRPGKVKGPDNVTTELSHNWRGQVTRSARTDGSTTLETLFTHDANGNLIQVQLPRTLGSGQRTGMKYTYDSADRMVSMEQGKWTSGLMTAVQSMRYEYDAWGNRTKTEWLTGAASGGTVKLSEGSQFDAFNRLTCIAKPFSDPCTAASEKTEFAYDPQGNLLQVRDAQGDDVRYGSGTLPSGSNPPMTWTYDRFGKIAWVQQETGSTLADIEYLYDAALNLSTVTIDEDVRGGSIVTSYTTDDFGGVVKVLSPDSGASFSRYDGAGRLLETKDAANKQFKYSYDRLGRVTKRERWTGTAYVSDLTYCYDGNNGNCVTAGSAQPQDKGRLTGVFDASGQTRFWYDTFGRLTSEARGLLSTGSVVSYTYDANGNRTSFTTPIGPAGSGGLTLSFTYDEADKLDAVAWSGPNGTGANLVQEVAWEPYGPVEKWRRPGLGLYYYSIIRDGAGRITNTRFKNDPATLISDSYSYAIDGNVSGIPSGAGNIFHDGASRLTQDRAASGTQSLCYDEAGNRTSRNSACTSPNYTYAATTNDRLSTAESRTFDYNSRGNVTCRRIGGTTSCNSGTRELLGYTDDGRVNSITTASGATTYTRDYQGRRVTKAGAGGSGTFFFNPEGELIHRQDPVLTIGCIIGRNIPSTYKKILNETYLHIDGRPAAVIRSRLQTACGSSSYTIFAVDSVDYYYTEKMGIPRGVLSDATGAISGSMTVDAFGNPMSTTGAYAVPFRLPGQYALSPAEGGPTTTTGGLHENWNRLYDSLTGRYLETDPMDAQLARKRGLEVTQKPMPFPGQMLDLPAKDIYDYAGSSPLRRSDPDGRGYWEWRVSECSKRGCNANVWCPLAGTCDLSSCYVPTGDDSLVTPIWTACQYSCPGVSCPGPSGAATEYITKPFFVHIGPFCFH